MVTADQALRQLSRELAAKAAKVLPRGMGRLTHEAVELELADWDRFKNRRQVGRCAGLTGGVSAPGLTGTPAPAAAGPVRP
jgi:transposase